MALHCFVLYSSLPLSMSAPHCPCMPVALQVLIKQWDKCKNVCGGNYIKK